MKFLYGNNLKLNFAWSYILTLKKKGKKRLNEAELDYGVGLCISALFGFRYATIYRRSEDLIVPHIPA